MRGQGKGSYRQGGASWRNISIMEAPEVNSELFQEFEIGSHWEVNNKNRREDPNLNDLNLMFENQKGLFEFEIERLNFDSFQISGK